MLHPNKGEKESKFTLRFAVCCVRQPKASVHLWLQPFFLVHLDDISFWGPLFWWSLRGDSRASWHQKRSIVAFISPVMLLQECRVKLSFPHWLTAEDWWTPQPLQHFTLQMPSQRILLCGMCKHTPLSCCYTPEVLNTRVCASMTQTL